MNSRRLSSSSIPVALLALTAVEISRGHKVILEVGSESWPYRPLDRQQLSANSEGVKSEIQVPFHIGSKPGGLLLCFRPVAVSIRAVGCRVNVVSIYCEELIPESREIWTPALNSYEFILPRSSKKHISILVFVSLFCGESQVRRWGWKHPRQADLLFYVLHVLRFISVDNIKIMWKSHSNFILIPYWSPAVSVAWNSCERPQLLFFSTFPAHPCWEVVVQHTDDGLFVPTLAVLVVQFPAA